MSEFNRRELLLKSTSAAAAVAAAYALRGPASTLLPGTARATTGPAWNHDPGSPIGPSHWADIDPAFGACAKGMQQSPVDLRPAQANVLHGAPLLLRYETSELAVENTGHVVEVPIPAGIEDVLLIGGDRYQLAQYHFHAPSEHTINGRHADVEGHFVHTNAAGDTAVVGVLYRIGPRPNPLLDTIFFNAPETSGTEGAPIGETNPAELFGGLEGARAKHGRVVVDSFYAYDGSLTTPGCTENVRWSVLSDGGHVSRAAVSRFHAVIAKFDDYGGYANNNRPVQPLNGRVVKLHCGMEHH
jgi:carbonic anhydrase